MKQKRKEKTNDIEAVSHIYTHIHTQHIYIYYITNYHNIILISGIVIENKC